MLHHLGVASCLPASHPAVQKIFRGSRSYHHENELALFLRLKMALKVIENDISRGCTRKYVCEVCFLQGFYFYLKVLQAHLFCLGDA